MSLEIMDDLEYWSTFAFTNLISMANEIATNGL